MNLRAASHSVRTRRARTLRQGRTAAAMRWGVVVIAVGVAMGIGIGTAELFLAQRDAAEQVEAENSDVSELHNPFAAIDAQMRDLGQPVQRVSSGFGDDN